MSSAETPDDPNTPEPTDEEVTRDVRNWLIVTGGLFVAVLVMLMIFAGLGTP